MVKIETKAATDNLQEIVQCVDMILVDRGDLSTEVGMLALPALQESIITQAKRNNVEVYLATQFLYGMQHSPVPLIAEAMDLYKTLKEGIHGLQLSEETAIGSYPLKCVQYVFSVVRELDY